MYLSEISPYTFRGAFGTAHQLFITLGIFFSSVFGLPQVLGLYEHCKTFTFFAQVLDLYEQCQKIALFTGRYSRFGLGITLAFGAF